jgi:hypothetical protein
VVAPHLYKPSLELTALQMAYFRPLELEMDMEAAMRGVPIITVMLVPPNISQVVSDVVMACN